MVFLTFDDADLAGGNAFSLAHISDPHISCIDDIRIGELFSKRLFGYLKWRLHRAAGHNDDILTALQQDLAETRPDHTAVTGDLTHLSLQAEFRKSRRWLESLGGPDRVTVVPGNHDTYVKTIWQQTLAHWTPYMLSDGVESGMGPVTGIDNIFPSLRLRDRIALIGVCTALPTAPHLATGAIGKTQLQKLEALMANSAGRNLFRILLIHHPPAPGTVSWRKRLTDAPALESLLRRYGAELVLHGHAHTSNLNTLGTPDGPVRVIGIPSATSMGRKPRRRARYIIYHISPKASGWQLRLQVRLYSPEKNRFVMEHEHPFIRKPESSGAIATRRFQQ
jgi:3',5'-cyclic AMP phosphodiesterase CpdA